MTEPEFDTYIEWIAREARRPVTVDAMAVQRVMAAIRAEPRPTRRRASWRWLVEPRALSLSPVAGLALAAGLVAMGAFIGYKQISRGGPIFETGPAQQVPEAQAPTSSDTIRVIKFVLVAPHAAKVSVVGDFNGWDPSATPMTRTPTGGTWSAEVRLPNGRHVYAFVLDGANGTQWVADPSAPLAPEDGLGAPNSVVLVGGSAS